MLLGSWPAILRPPFIILMRTGIETCFIVPLSHQATLLEFSSSSWELMKRDADEGFYGPSSAASASLAGRSRWFTVRFKPKLFRGSTACFLQVANGKFGTYCVRFASFDDPTNDVGKSSIDYATERPFQQSRAFRSPYCENRLRWTCGGYGLCRRR